MVADFDKLIEAFAYHVEAQTREIFNGDARTGNKHAKKAIAAFDKLCAHGDAGRDALAVTFQTSEYGRADVSGGFPVTPSDSGGQGGSGGSREG